MIVLQGQTTEPKDVSGQINHASVRVSQTVQQKRAGQTSLLTQIENLLTPGTQDHLNPEAMNLEAVNQEDHASLQAHLIEASEQDRVLDTVQIHLNVQLVTIAASAPIVQHAISAAIHSADLETLQETRLEILEELTSHVQTRESMTATVTLTVKTESQETSHAIRLLLALATRIQTAKHSLRTKFSKSLLLQTLPKLSSKVASKRWAFTQSLFPLFVALEQKHHFRFSSQPFLQRLKAEMFWVEEKLGLVRQLLSLFQLFPSSLQRDLSQENQTSLAL
jgi:hypothetical protein